MSCKQILPLTRSSVLTLLLRIIISANGWHDEARTRPPCVFRASELVLGRLGHVDVDEKEGEMFEATILHTAPRVSCVQYIHIVTIHNRLGNCAKQS